MAEIVETPIDNIITEQTSQNLVHDVPIEDAVDIGEIQVIRPTYIGVDTDTIQMNVDNQNRTISANLVSSQYESKLAFPSVGSNKILYVDLSDNSIWRFDIDDLIYVCVGRDYTEIEVINGGNA